jgi:hypothetical protein
MKHQGVHLPGHKLEMHKIKLILEFLAIVINTFTLNITLHILLFLIRIVILSLTILIINIIMIPLPSGFPLGPFSDGCRGIDMW